MICLTSGQKLIVAIVVLVLVVYLIVDWLLTARGEPPLPRATRRLKQELERHKNEE
jgi:hypothetical protein